MCSILFFQAEDGIRYLTVTGVQTCALPICRRHGHRLPLRSLEEPPEHLAPVLRRQHLREVGDARDAQAAVAERLDDLRGSEERRVGKECRSWWLPDH